MALGTGIAEIVIKAGDGRFIVSECVVDGCKWQRSKCKCCKERGSFLHDRVPLMFDIWPGSGHASKLGDLHKFDNMALFVIIILLIRIMLHHLRPLAVFTSVVEHGSMRAAAKALQLSPSVVSHHLSQLEEQLGVALLYRSTRKLSLTRNGERLLPHARQMLQSAEEGISAALDSIGELSGELRVTVPALFSSSPLAEKIAQFAIENPKVRLSLDFSEVPRDMIDEGIDVAIRAGWLRDSQMKARKLYEEERVLIASSAYIEARETPQTPNDLIDWDWLELSPVALRPTFTNSEGARATPKVTSKLAANNAAALYHLCRSGAGLAILPKFMAENELKSGEVLSILPEWKLASIGVYALRPHNSPREGLAAKFIAALE